MSSATGQAKRQGFHHLGCYTYAMSSVSSDTQAEQESQEELDFEGAEGRGLAVSRQLQPYRECTDSVSQARIICHDPRTD